MGFNGCRITSLTSIESGEAFNGAPLSVCQHSERGQHQSSLCSAGHRCQRHLEPMAATNRVYRDGDDGPGPRRPTHHSPGFYQRNHRCFQRVFVTLASSLLIPDLTSDPVGIKENQNGQKMALSYDWHWKIIGRRQRAPHCHYSRNGINKIWTVAMVTPPLPLTPPSSPTHSKGDGFSTLFRVSGIQPAIPRAPMCVWDQIRPTPLPSVGLLAPSSLKTPQRPPQRARNAAK